MPSWRQTEKAGYPYIALLEQLPLQVYNNTRPSVVLEIIQGNSAPGRIDSILYSKKVLGAPQAPTVMCCHVDQEERCISRSDHRLVTTQFPSQRFSRRECPKSELANAPRQSRFYASPI